MSQCTIILDLLTAQSGQWVAMPFLANQANCFAVNSRVSDLRERGHDIENKIEQKDGATHSFYRITADQAAENKAWILQLCDLPDEDCDLEFDLYCADRIDELEEIEDEIECKEFFEGFLASLEPDDEPEEYEPTEQDYSDAEDRHFNHMQGV